MILLDVILLNAEKLKIFVEFLEFVVQVLFITFIAFHFGTDILQFDFHHD